MKIRLNAIVTILVILTSTSCGSSDVSDKKNNEDKAEVYTPKEFKYLKGRVEEFGEERMMMTEIYLIPPFSTKEDVFYFCNEKKTTDLDEHHFIFVEKEEYAELSKPKLLSGYEANPNALNHITGIYRVTNGSEGKVGRLLWNGKYVTVPDSGE